MRSPLSTPALLAASLLLPCLNGGAADTILTDEGSPVSVLIPSATNGGSTLSVADWTNVANPPNQANWTAGTSGVGYDDNPDYGGDIGLDVGTGMVPEMQGQNPTAYIRVPFSIDQATINSTQTLVLNIKYDDGFVAYLNGTEIESVNPPQGALTFQSEADGNHEAGTNFESFDITTFLGLLQAGDNMLAIHGLNDNLGSSDFLILPQLVASDDVAPVWPDIQFGNPVVTAVNPTDITHAGDGSGRVFIAERAGRIRIWDGNTLTTFLDIIARVQATSNVTSNSEQGLLGIAFPKGFAQKQYFYVSYIANGGDTVLSRFDVNPNDADDADENSETIILQEAQPEGNHNGGQIHFGIDGYLYFGFGDGGGAGDDHGAVETARILRRFKER